MGWKAFRLASASGLSDGLGGRRCYLTIVTWEREKPGATKDVREPTAVPDAYEWTIKRLGISPDEQQKLVLTSAAKRGILNCSRQWGKSTMAAAKAVHRAWSQGGQMILVASPTERQSWELIRKAAGMMRKLGMRPRGDGANDCSLQFPNDSRIVGLPGREGTVRGFSAVSLMLIDEAARVEDSMYKALRPMLAVTDGELWMMSTPWGKRGFFFECWEYGQEEWERVSVPATKCGRISKNFLERERRELGTLWFEQEYMCQFVDNGAGIFARDVVEGALDERIVPLAGFGTWDRT